MSELRISLFGGVHVGFGGATEMKLTRIVRGLLAYLVLYRERSHSRDLLACLFWAEHSEQSARSCLNTALWRLRRILEPDAGTKGAYLVTTVDGDVAFNRDSDYWLDVEEFDASVDKFLSVSITDMKPDQAKGLEGALNLYVAELLEGYYDDWTFGERDRYRTKYLLGMERLMEYHDLRKSYDNAISYGKKILYHDPLREDVHRDVMRIFAQSGQRTRAIRHYEDTCALLDKELGVPPAIETKALYDRIRQLADGRLIAASQHTQSPGFDAVVLDQIAGSVHSAIEDCDAIRHRLIHLDSLIRSMTENKPYSSD